MSDNLQSLKDIFSNKVIRIPNFQRGYSWDVEQLSALWDDLLNLVPYKDIKFHFTGILVFERITKNNLSKEWKEEFSWKDFEDNQVFPFSLVDGQQRLTSIIIILYLLTKEVDEYFLKRYKFTEKEKSDFTKLFLKKSFGDGKKFLFGYEIDTPSHQYLLSKIFEDEEVLLEEPETVYTQNLSFAKSFFQDKLKETGVSTMYSILDILLNKLKFSELILSPDQIDISMVFETLNFRGKPLSNLELLKNRLLYLLSQSNGTTNRAKSLKKKIIDTWLTIYEYLGKRSRWIDEDEFLRSFWLIYYDQDRRTKGHFNEYKQDIFHEIFSISGEQNEHVSPKKLTHFLKYIE